MEVYQNKNRCSGCTACINSCPVNAITMVADQEGFKYPQIDETTCTECDLCQKICPFHEGYFRDTNLHIPKVYAAKHINDDIRIASSSGGMFTALSDYILQKDGVIYGVAFDNDFRVCHKKAETAQERDKFRGSKYVQSDLGNIFQDVKVELDKKRDVLFTGTPCQIAGLKAYLGKKNYTSLILCDLVCHGTPSPLIWRDYVSLLEKTKGCSLQSFSFRDKGKGWHNSRLCAQFVDGTTLYNTPIVDCFDSIFYQHIALRPSCHTCVFTNFTRPSDITIADFWGIENSKPEFDDNKGISLVLVNTKKGEAMFEKVKSGLVFEASTMDDCRQRHLIVPAEPSPKREVFWNDYYGHGFEYVAKKYTEYGLRNRFKQRVLKPVLDKLGVLDLARSLLRRK